MALATSTTRSVPFKGGVITDFEVTDQMLRHFIREVNQSRWVQPRVISVPSGVTDVERAACLFGRP